MTLTRQLWDGRLAPPRPRLFDLQPRNWGIEREPARPDDRAELQARANEFNLCSIAQQFRKSSAADVHRPLKTV